MVSYKIKEAGWSETMAKTEPPRASHRVAHQSRLTRNDRMRCDATRLDSRQRRLVCLVGECVRVESTGNCKASFLQGSVLLAPRISLAALP